ncbi:MAG: response regulator [Planctomyces sp.]|nr:response regulator [Planctomyces sp.]
MTTRTIHPILIVEDCPEDHEAMTRSLREAGLANPIFVCDDGDSALNYLYRRGKFAAPESAPRPGLILLDLTLPATDGREVLREIKSDPELKGIPVVVMTSSFDLRDVEDCYLAGANSYVTKPVDLDGLVQAVKRLKEFWFGIVVLPRAN